MKPALNQVEELAQDYITAIRTGQISAAEAIHEAFSEELVVFVSEVGEDLSTLDVMGDTILERVEGYVNKYGVVPTDSLLRNLRVTSDNLNLTCKNHPEQQWITKNVGPIGSSRIFFQGPGATDQECVCAYEDLRVLLPAGVKS